MGTAPISEIETTVADAARRLGPAVVGLGRGWHRGSGVVVGEGLVLTAAHNVRGEEQGVTFADGRRASARVRGVDQAGDLALLEVDTGEIEPVESAPDTEAAQIGSAVVALANPGGRGLRATLGFVSSTERGFRGPGGRRVSGCLEHTAPLPRGSSGGPLVDTSGRLLALNAIRLEGGLIVAVPAVGAARERLEALEHGEQAQPVRLGVAVAPPYVARKLRRAVGLPEQEGVLVRGVEDGSAADLAGIERGDLIVAVGGNAVDGIDALHAALDAAAPGDSLALALVRGTEERQATVTLARVGETDAEKPEAAR
jgi:serine protease Do